MNQIASALKSWLIVVAAIVAPTVLHAQAIVSEDFTSTTTTNSWYFFNGACLTAGTTSASTSPGQIPSCLSLQSTYYNQNLVGGYAGYLGSAGAPSSLTSGSPDPGATATSPGNGALRFTNGSPGGGNQSGAIVSASTFPTGQGVQITFKTVTYRGNSGGSGGDGADGISFFLMDGGVDLTQYPGVGAYGGSLGYTCSNTNPPYDGLYGGYLGLGIDEYGNFLNGAANTLGETGSVSTNGGIGDNTASGGLYQPGRIGLRGAGGVSWKALTNSYGTDNGSSSPYYPASLASTCSNGGVYSAATNSCGPVCPVGFYNSARNTCDTCPAGTAFYSPNNTCNSCPSGTYDVGTNTCSPAATCATGVYVPATNTCNPMCPTAGTTFDAGRNKCDKCTSANGSGLTAGFTCAVCPSGSTYDLAHGSVATPCAKCTNGTYSTTTGLCSRAPTTPTRVAQTTTATPTTSSVNSPTPVAVTAITPTRLAPSTGVPYARLAVQNTCKTGYLYNYTNPAAPTNVGTATIDNPVNTAKILDYAAIPTAYSVLDPAVVKIANESAVTRSDGTPIFYNLKITQDGLLSFAYSFNGAAYQSVITKQSITASNGSLPASFRFGFAGSTGGSTNVHEIMCFKAAPADQSSSSTGVNEKQSAKIEDGIQAYFAYYNPNNWTGRLTANGIGINTDGTVFVSSLATWDASCVLTGVPTGTCLTTGAAGPATAQAPATRKIISWDGSSGIPFKFTSLTSTQQATLDAGDATQTATRLLYLRGSRTNEVDTTGVGLYRARESVLGDIVDSSPTWVGPPQSPYTASWKDRLHPLATAPENTGTQNYVQFVTAEQSRLNVVYAGANDGMLHGFRTGSFDSNNVYVNNSTTPNDGQEVLAYFPGMAVNTIHSGTDSTLDYSSTQYGHNFNVDGTPGTGDVFYNGTWHTWLVGGMGPGGAAIYALDITDPSPTNFTESNAASIVMGEWKSGPAATTGAISCANVTDCGMNLGNTYGIPQIRRFHNGQWGAVFGNGLGSTSGDAGIYVMLINPSTGAKSFYYVTTGTGTVATPGNDGIAYVAPADLDGDHITDYVYAGDLKGNVWRFDLTDTNPTNWVAGASPVFTTQAGQPITTRIVVASGPTDVGGPPRLMLGFGTGQKTPITNLNPTTYSSGGQDLYGVWDWNMSGWNAKSSASYASLDATAAATGLSSPGFTAHRANLTQQVVTIDATTKDRDIQTNAAICFQGSTACTTGTFGWYLDLPGNTSQGSEQIVFNPQLLGSAFVVNSTVPADNVPTSCTVNTDTGFTYAVSMITGAALNNFFPQYHDSEFPSGSTTGGIAGIETDATGTSFPVTTATGATWLVYQTVLNAHQTTQVNLPTNTKAKRLTWIELR